MTETIWIRGNYQRDHAKRVIDAAEIGSAIRISKARRSLPQNDRLWAMLTEIAAAKPMSRELPPEIWKTLFLHQLGQEMRFEAALDGRGLVPINYRSSALTKQEFRDLFLVIEQFAAENGITLSDEGKNHE